MKQPKNRRGFSGWKLTRRPIDIINENVPKIETPVLLDLKASKTKRPKTGYSTKQRLVNINEPFSNTVLNYNTHEHTGESLTNI